jgi:tRNA G18 (ribose-2'-O)-methylase SpoU
MQVEPVDDLADPRLFDYRDLATAAERGVFVAESRLIVRRLIESGRFATRSVLLTRPAFGDLRDVLETRRDVRVFVAGHATIKGVVGYNFHRGCLAVGERPTGSGVSDLADGCGSSRPLLVLERLSNPDNVGAMFRNAQAFGVGGVLLSPGCGDPLYRKAIRVSMGGALQVPFATAADWPADLGRLRDAGFALIALTPHGAAEDIARVRSFPGRVALLVGAEGEGLSEAAREHADREMRIAMAPGVDSLNVATAAAVALHRLVSSRMSLAPAVDQV